jgi:hypothetical protein
LKMANLLQSSQNKTTTTPQFYTDYLSNIATKGQQAACQAEYVGAQPLQTQAFQKVCENFGQYQPAIQQGQGLLTQAGGQDITGAAQPFLQAGTTASPLCAARPMICGSANLNLADLASEYMNPFINTAVKSLSDIGQRNIRQNLSPAATAAAVGSGQFGSQRGAQVLGQIQAQAEQDLNNQIAQMLGTGYGQALTAAGQKQGALTNLAQQIASAQQAQNQANLTAGQTAAQAAAQQASAQTQAGLGKGTLAQAGSGMNLACINALATLGGQQQTIAQNEQNYPLTKLSSLASLLQGASIPTSTKTTLCMSPLSAIGTIGSGALGMLTPKYDQYGNVIPGSRPIDYVGKAFGGAGGAYTGGIGGTSPCYTGGGQGYDGCNGVNYSCQPNCGSGCYPAGCCSCCSGYCCAATGGSIPKKAVGGGVMGCASTRSYGALPSKKG